MELRRGAAYSKRGRLDWKLVIVKLLSSAPIGSGPVWAQRLVGSVAGGGISSSAFDMDLSRYFGQ